MIHVPSKSHGSWMLCVALASNGLALRWFGDDVFGPDLNFVNKRLTEHCPDRPQSRLAKRRNPRTNIDRKKSELADDSAQKEAKQHTKPPALL